MGCCRRFLPRVWVWIRVWVYIDLAYEALAIGISDLRQALIYAPGSNNGTQMLGILQEQSTSTGRSCAPTTQVEVLYTHHFYDPSRLS